MGPFITSNSYMPSWIVRLWLPKTRLGIATIHAFARIVAASGIDKLISDSTAQEELQTLEYPDYFGLVTWK